MLLWCSLPAWLLVGWQLSAMLKRFFPHLPHVGGEELDAITGNPTKPTKDFMRAYCMLARQELGLKTYSIDETVRATGESYLELGLVKTATSAKL